MDRPLNLLRYSLIAVWLGTALVSLLDFQHSGQRLLQEGGISDVYIPLLITGGAAADMAVGLILWLKPGRLAYRLALALMLLMTLIATCLLPGLWLDPLGALLKNLPIAAALIVLLQQEKAT